MVRVAEEGVRYLRQAPITGVLGVEVGTEYARSRHSSVTGFEHRFPLGGTSGFEARALSRTLRSHGSGQRGQTVAAENEDRNGADRFGNLSQGLMKSAGTLEQSTYEGALLSATGLAVES